MYVWWPPGDGPVPALPSAVVAGEGRETLLLTPVEDDAVVGRHRRASGASPERRRRRRGLVVLAVLGAVLAFLVTRPDGGGADAAPPTTTTIPPTTTSEPLDARTPNRDRSTTTSTTSTVPGREVLGPLLPDPTGATFVTSSGRELAVVEVDTGVVRRIDLRGQNLGLVASTGSVVVVAGNRVVVLDPDISDEVIDLGAADDVVASGRPGHVWFQRFGPDGVVLEEVAVDGSGTTTELSLPPEASDVVVGPGGLLVNLLGTIVRYDPESGEGEVVGDGRGLAVVGDRLLRATCDAGLACGLRIGDLGGGDDRAIALPEGLASTAYAEVLVSPDERRAILFVQPRNRGGSTVVLVDAEAATAAVVAEVDGYARSPAAFSPDGRWLFVRDGSAVTAIDVETELHYPLIGLDLAPVPDGSIVTFAP